MSALLTFGGVLNLILATVAGTSLFFHPDYREWTAAATVAGLLSALTLFANASVVSTLIVMERKLDRLLPDEPVK